MSFSPHPAICNLILILPADFKFLIAFSENYIYSAPVNAFLIYRSFPFTLECLLCILLACMFSDPEYAQIAVISKYAAVAYVGYSSKSPPAS